MAELQSQPAAVVDSKIESQSVDKDALIIRLDELLEKYLHTLDEYQKTREQLSKQLSSGYLSLAQANFQNRSTTHYGKDNYDERMQAIRKVTIQGYEPSTTDDRINFSIIPEKEAATDVKDTSSKEPKDEKPEATAPESTSSTRSEESKNAAKPVDPLRWFGILVPPALRSAQSSFISTVEGSVPHLASVAKELRIQEIEIGRVRKQIKRS